MVVVLFLRLFVEREKNGNTNKFTSEFIIFGKSISLLFFIVISSDSFISSLFNYFK
jgi:hypothetical protein